MNGKSSRSANFMNVLISNYPQFAPISPKIFANISVRTVDESDHTIKSSIFILCKTVMKLLVEKSKHKMQYVLESLTY